MARSAKAPKTEVITFDTAKEIEELRSRLLASSGNRIRIANKQFHFPNGDMADEIDIVVVDFIYANKYYSSAYVPGSVEPPDCFALEFDPKELAPSANSPDAQSSQCASCPLNQFGSRGKGKACGNRIAIAVLPSDAKLDTPLQILEISPTAIKGFSNYVSTVARVLGCLPFGVVTHVSLNPSIQQDVAIFSDPQLIEDKDYILMVRSRRQEARELLMIEPDIAAMQAQAQAPAPKGRKLMTPKRAAASAGARR
jgi:hypothetical protein